MTLPLVLHSFSFSLRMSSCSKKRKLNQTTPVPVPEWRLYPSDHSKPPPTVFVRPKSAKEHGQIARQIRETDNGRVLVELEGGVQKVFDRKRLLPVFESSPTAPLLLLTPDTTPYRNLAWSQLTHLDRVLEIGCSTGECSAILLRRTKNWMGLDTSTQMIANCQQMVGKQFLDKVVKSDCLVNPIQTRDTVRNVLGEPTHVFIDIGGNRDWTSVVKVISWTYECFLPRLVVVKSQELVAEYNVDMNHAIDKETDTLDMNGWFNAKLKSISTKVVFPKHAKDAPWAFSPVDNTPICRYHNYNIDGCQKISHGCKLDHEHCHLCLVKGHIALNCLRTRGEQS